MFKYILAFILIITIILVAVTFGVNNNQLITFNYMIAKSEIRISTLVAVIFGSGVFFGWLVSMIFYIKLKIKYLKLSRQQKNNNNTLGKSTQLNKAK